MLIQFKYAAPVSQVFAFSLCVCVCVCVSVRLGVACNFLLQSRRSRRPPSCPCPPVVLTLFSQSLY